MFKWLKKKKKNPHLTLRNVYVSAATAWYHIDFKYIVRRILEWIISITMLLLFSFMNNLIVFFDVCFVWNYRFYVLIMIEIKMDFLFSDGNKLCRYILKFVLIEIKWEISIVNGNQYIKRINTKTLISSCIFVFLYE